MQCNLFFVLFTNKIVTMSVMNFQKTFRDVKPPEKGSFPLDHEGSELSFGNACMTIPEIC